MLIVTEKKIINAVNVFAFTVDRQYDSLPNFETTGYQLRAWHSGYVDDNGNADYILVRSYAKSEEQQAKADLEKILAAYLSASENKTVDLR